MMEELKDDLLYRMSLTLLEEKMKVEVINRELIANAVNECSKIGPLLDENKNIAQVIELLEEKFDYELRKNSIEVEVGMTLADPKKHINWKIQGKYYYWNLHKNFISEEYKRKDPSNWQKILKTIDEETDSILYSMENPIRDEFSSLGLVIGYVQSGKTANFTALTAKAMDAGYQLVIVLAGMHNTLRAQTQSRLDRELFGYDDYNTGKTNIDSLYSDKLRRPVRVTKTAYVDIFDDKVSDGDFKLTIDKLKEIIFPNVKYNKVAAIVKKNVTVLKRLNNWLNNCPKDVRDKIALMVIDDEADQASVDANYIKNIKKGKSAKGNETQTNKEIINLLEKFKKSTYVGYTATPYANCFIDPNYDNLYPRNFIHFLPKPEKYFGAEEIFGDDELKAAYVVTDGVGTKADALDLLDKDELPESLNIALYSFLVSLAIRVLRVEGQHAMSMLIHIDHRKESQKDIYELVDKFFSVIKINIKKKTAATRKLKDSLKKVYEQIVFSGEIINYKAGLKREFFDFDQVLEVLINEINSIEIKQVHSDSEDEINYLENPGLRVIAVGGNKLSRGLTLEGLMCTYFLRGTEYADTLMQMGRFFGYRGDYQDLMKIYTHNKIVENFEYMIGLESDLRAEVERYIDEDKTPLDFAPSVRAHSKMKPSGRMGNAQRFRKAFGSSIIQTKYFKLPSKRELENNMKTAITFVSDLKSASYKLVESKTVKDSKFFKNVDLEIIERFLQSLTIPEFDVNIRDVLQYLKDNDVKFLNVGFPTLIGNDNRFEPFGSCGNFALVSRSRKKTSPKNGYYSIGVLTDSADLTIDLERTSDGLTERSIPILLLYRINKDSIAKKGSKSRQDLFKDIKEKADLFGFGIQFPPSQKSELDIWSQDF
jgi:hypothetical protein